MAGRHDAPVRRVNEQQVHVLHVPEPHDHVKVVAQEVGTGNNQHGLRQEPGTRNGRQVTQESPRGTIVLFQPNKSAPGQLGSSSVELPNTDSPITFRVYFILRLRAEHRRSVVARVLRTNAFKGTCRLWVRY